jgi:hypothetical protein
MLRRLGLFPLGAAVLRPSSSATCRSCIEMNLRMSTRSCGWHPRLTRTTKTMGTGQLQ